MTKTRPERIVIRISKQFKVLRLARGMSHEEMARRSGVTRPAISHIESGKRKPSLFMALRLAEALEKDLSQILYEAESAEKREE